MPFSGQPGSKKPGGWKQFAKTALSNHWATGRGDCTSDAHKIRHDQPGYEDGVHPDAATYGAGDASPSQTAGDVDLENVDNLAETNDVADHF